jgi:hypothetical protein
LAALLGVPWLLALIDEEMGARRKRGPTISGIVALALVAVYLGWRGKLHADAFTELYSNTYHGEQAMAVEAFPTALSPYAWRGVVSTYNSIDTVPVVLGSYFDPSMALTHFMAEQSPTLKAAEAAPGLSTWRNFARFPLADVERTYTGHEVVFRDLRYDPVSHFWLNPIVTVDLDKSNRVTKVSWRFGN